MSFQRLYGAETFGTVITHCVSSFVQSYRSNIFDGECEKTLKNREENKKEVK